MITVLGNTHASQLELSTAPKGKMHVSKKKDREIKRNSLSFTDKDYNLWDRMLRFVKKNLSKNRNEKNNQKYQKF